ncbi:hypothetical protein EIN_226280 [Entamoeba invadens IP1]|uniref:Rho-GAP domain-containing protein n=1 Tax=Entamoeba invadens IP1 TaxID=370355 RepID=A0A0A1U5W7_ENTIV|nr:hypothetical protein EIN_226280 [Entamoeba invadens IP1]ELP88265.1 hypothetical protein EIN_226280 [Entamoeba invadens IP1]|eukprot:XP_004255036.1 hypothetical protein EIN_226280 [Entamoeba invadens IP1]
MSHGIARLSISIKRFSVLPKKEEPKTMKSESEFTLTQSTRERIQRSSLYIKSPYEIQAEPLVSSFGSMAYNRNAINNMSTITQQSVYKKGCTKDVYKNRRMSWRSKNTSEEKRDLMLVASDDNCPNVLSDKELKEYLKEEHKKQKLLLSDDPSKKGEMVFDIQCLQSHIVTTVKECLTKTLKQVVEKLLKTKKETVNTEQLVFRNHNGKTLEKDVTMKTALSNNVLCIYVSLDTTPFTLPKIYPMDVHKNDPHNAIPQVVFNMCWWIYTYGHSIEGIFRISGKTDFAKKKVSNLVVCDTSFLYQMKQQTSDVHNVVATLKLYLREYTNSLINYEDIKTINVQKDKVAFIIECLQKGRREDLECISILYGLIARLVKYAQIHKMTLKNFAMILGPLVIHPGSSVNAINATCNQIEFSRVLATNYDQVMAGLNLSNPFVEFPDKKGMSNFDSTQVDLVLNEIKNQSIKSLSQIEKLQSLIEMPETISYLNTVKPALVLDVISSITQFIDL